MNKISAKHSETLFKIFLTLIMSSLMAFVITALNLGIGPGFLEKVIVAFAAGVIVSFPAILIAVPVSKRIVKRITAED
ncbi:MAG: DUF2798 domain-containing protein, partial [archaeon]|nr:DUF2798 domain-containing protein [archaeon]